MHGKSKIFGVLGFATLVIAMTAVFSMFGITDAGAQSSNVVVFATGLNNPRGLKFGPDNNLYVAEGGLGGTSINTIGQCLQVPSPIGPYTTDGPSARISRIDSHGAVTTVVDGLPSSQTSAASGGFVSGVADVAFIGRTLYAVIAGAGCSHGFPGIPNSIIRINDEGRLTQVAHLSQFIMDNPVAQPNADDFEPDGTWYGMIAVHGKLYTVEPNHGEMDQISQGGDVRRIIDVSAAEGHIVPTAITFRHDRDHEDGSNGDFCIGNLDVFPATLGESNIYKVTAKGNISITQSGVMTVLGVQFDNQGRLYVLETFTVAGFPSPAAAGTGAIVRFDNSGSSETVASGLTFPTAMTFGPDGKLYVSNFGFGAPAGAGQIVQITVPK